MIKDKRPTPKPSASRAASRTAALPASPGPAAKPGAAVPVRIQKVLADAGLGSRREIEGWIEAGRIEINGEVAKLGDRMVPGDRIRLDRRELRLAPPSAEPLRVIAYNKPEGEVVTRHDPEGRPTIFRHL
ncbi:MAG: hypothetical protein KA204_11030, partial [Chromatiaceae bacterium]|nr:hypothetical protein [Chromatiaceae bacterium]